MASVPLSFGFYAILTNPVVGYERLAAICADHAIAFIQLRMKDASARDVERIGRAVKKCIDGSASRFIINDYPEVARDIGADGVHLGQNDMPYAQARAIVGPGAIVGLSTHSPDQTAAACSLQPDYIGIGPVFPTPTKKIPDPPIGIDGMKRMLATASVPAVVLGAITLEALPEILKNGARNFAMVRPINQSDEPEKVLNQILKIYDDVKSVP